MCFTFAAASTSRYEKLSQKRSKASASGPRIASPRAACHNGSNRNESSGS